MPSEFQFTGGVWKPGPEAGVTFLCFMVVGGEEVPLFQMKRNGLVDIETRVNEAGGMEQFFVTAVTNVVKVFVQDMTAGNRRWYSFYFRIKDKKHPLVTIRPFPPPASAVAFDTGFLFKARGSFLSKNDAVSLLSPESPSLGYLKNQRLLPIPILQKMVTIDRNVIREGVRVIRLGKAKTQ